MSEHESHHDVAGMLALAAAGALDAQEQRRLQEHASARRAGANLKSGAAIRRACGNSPSRRSLRS